MTHKVTIMRKWNSPLISIDLTAESIGISMSLDNFIEILTDEVAEPLVRDVVQNAGNPAFVMTKAQLEKKLVDAIESEESRKLFREAALRIIDAMKQETRKVV
jgi:hypothetical protein